MISKIKAVWDKLEKGEDIFLFFGGAVVIGVGVVFVSWITIAVFKFAIGTL